MRSATVKYKSSDMLNYFFFWKINRGEVVTSRYHGSEISG